MAVVGGALGGPTGLATAGTPADGSAGSAERRGSQTQVDPGGTAPGKRVIGLDINVYQWGTPDPDSGKKAQDDGDWLEVKGGGGEVWSKGHVYDADYRSGASALRGGATSTASVVVHVEVPADCVGWATCSDAITMPWDYTVSGDGIHVIHCVGTATDIKGGTHEFTLDPADLSSTYAAQKAAGAAESQRGGASGGVGFPEILKIDAHDEGTVTSNEDVQFQVTSSSAKAKSGVVILAKVTDTKQVVGGQCAWEFGSGVLDVISAQALIARADTSLGSFDVLHGLETSWRIVCTVEPTKSHGPHDNGPLPRHELAPDTRPITPVPDDAPPGGNDAGPTPDDGATAKIVGPVGLAGEAGATPGLLLLETDRTGGRALTWTLDATPAGRVRLPATLVVRAGDPSGTATFTGLEAGEFTVRATLLDASGAPTSSTLLVDGVCRSTTTLAAPRLSMRADGLRLDPRSGRWVGLAGSDAGGLTLERSGFACLADTATTFVLEATDPLGVLRGLPTTATIAAGETSLRLPLGLADAVGDAEVVVSCGAFTERVAVRSVRQALECPFVGATVPVGGRAVLPVALRVPEGAPRTLLVAAADPAVASVPVLGSALTLAAGAPRVWVGFEARAVGSTLLQVTTPGAPEVALHVAVVPSEVEVTRTRITLSSLGVDASGVLRLALPAGVTWAQATGDGATGVEVVNGVGTSTLVVRVGPKPDRGTSVDLDVALAGAPDTSFDVQVTDRVHEGRSIYQVSVR